MSKIAVLALVVLMSGVVGASSALAGGGVRTPPARIGKIDRDSGAKVKKFVSRKLHKKSTDQKKARSMGPTRLPGL